MSRTAIIDYGSGNIFSLLNAMSHVGANVEVISKPEDLDEVDQIIVPGVGAFAACMDKLTASGFVKKLMEAVQQEKKILGICVGMQILFEQSFEFGTHQGLGIFAGSVVRLPLQDALGNSLQVPHVGWAKLMMPDDEVNSLARHPLIAKLNQDDEYYFVHSYMAQPEDSDVLFANASYSDVDVTAVVGRDNVLGLQFHPEKSGRAGLDLLQGWNEL